METDYCTKWVEAKPLRDNMAGSTAKFLYRQIWCRFGCPIELISDQGGHFLNAVVEGITHHYTVVHKKSTPYYPQANGLAESTNKTLQNILRKIVNENRTDWEAVMHVEFQIPSLRIQVRERMPEEESQQLRLEQLLALGETRVKSLAALELEQLRRKAFVDRHRGRNEEEFEIGRAVLVFQTCMGKMPGKLRFRWTGPYWIVAAEKVRLR